jgi:hypothetical protein
MAKCLAQLFFRGLEARVVGSGQGAASTIDIQVEHRHGGLELRALRPPAPQHRAFEALRDRRRRTLEDAGGEVHRIGRLCHSTYPALLPRRVASHIAVGLARLGPSCCLSPQLFTTRRRARRRRHDIGPFATSRRAAPGHALRGHARGPRPGARPGRGGGPPRPPCRDLRPVPGCRRKAPQRVRDDRGESVLLSRGPESLPEPVRRAAPLPRRGCAYLGLAIPLSETPCAPLHAWEVRRAIEEVTANRRAFADRLAEARAWEIEVIEGREAVLERMLALA